MGPYIADFVCTNHQVIIEVDGESHAHQGSHTYDTNRTYFLEQEGYRVLRVTNDDVLRDVDRVADYLGREILKLPHVEMRSLEGTSSPQEEKSTDVR